MKKSELKRILKPLVKECIMDVLLEEGLLSNVVSEVAKGLTSNMVVESKVAPTPDKEHMKLLEEKQELLKQQRKKMLNATGFTTDIFEGTEPTRAGKSDSHPQAGALAGVDPDDAGIDLSGIMAVAGRSWRDMI
jgi:hypothetical protein